MSFLRDASRRGWRYTGSIIFNRLVPAWLFRCRRFVIYRLRSQTALDGHSNVKIEWCETDEQYQLVEKLTHFKREAAGAPVRAVQATVENELHGGFWMAIESYIENELGVRVMLEPKQCWLFAAKVSKNMRERGIYSNILRFITSELHSQGIQDLLVSVNPTNKPSNHVHQKHADSCIGNATAIRFLNWAWCFSSPSIKQKSSFTSNAKLRPIELSVPLFSSNNQPSPKTSTQSLSSECQKPKTEN